MQRFEIELKQHTPIIHFQYNQDGATIRATELKPKLDKFLLKEVFKDSDFEGYKEYLIGYNSSKTEEDFKGRMAFNYKVKIQNIYEDNAKNRYEHKIYVKKIEKCGLYFANMNKNKEEVKARFVFCEGVKIEFISFHDFLIDKIIEVLPKFLMNHNFGQRQSKGFGSFYINDKWVYRKNGVECYYDNTLKKRIGLDYYLEFPKQSHNEYKMRSYYSVESMFTHLNNFYKELRPGTVKMESYLKKYTLSRNIVWDKDIIKLRFVRKSLKVLENGFLIKDLFGLSTREEWGTHKFAVTKKHKNSEIERFMSPILFKPIRESNCKFTVHFRLDEIPSELLNQEFDIEKENMDDKITLKTPKQFDLHDFIEFVKKHGKYDIKSFNK